MLDADVSSNNHLAADRFRFRLAGLDALTAVDAPSVRFDVQVGMGGAWSSLVQGEADSVGLDPIRGTIDVEGRDLSALLIDSRVDETFANRTSSEIAEVLAGRHGLGINATATTTLVGRYYQSDFERVTMGTGARAMSEWDLLSYLAVHEGFDLFMDGDVLRFETAGGGTSIVLSPDNCESISLEHLLGMERAIEVTVRSWDQQGAQAVAKTARGGGNGRSWKHSVVRPNLPPDEAQRLAERVLADLVRHTRTVSATLPGDLVLTPRSLVMLQGTGSDWDGAYAVSDVTRTIIVQRGFSQRLRLQKAA